MYVYTVHVSPGINFEILWYSLIKCHLQSPAFFSQWNSHGYDVAKIFSPKFTYVSPVWLQVKRRFVLFLQLRFLHVDLLGCVFTEVGLRGH